MFSNGSNIRSQQKFIVAKQCLVPAIPEIIYGGDVHKFGSSNSHELTSKELVAYGLFAGLGAV